MLFVVSLCLYVVIFVNYLCALIILRKVIMMNNVFAVFDSCSGLFGDPFIAVNEAVARRVFEYSLANLSVPQYVRDDSVLYCIGYYDNKTGYVTNEFPPFVICRGSSVVPDVSRNSADEEVTDHA